MTPSGKQRVDTKKAPNTTTNNNNNTLKRPGSAHLSESSDNENARKKIKTGTKTAPATALPSRGATPIPGRPKNPQASAMSDGEVTAGEVSDAGSKLKPKLKVKPGVRPGGTPAGSRSGSPAPSGTSPTSIASQVSLLTLFQALPSPAQAPRPLRNSLPRRRLRLSLNSPRQLRLQCRRHPTASSLLTSLPRSRRMRRKVFRSATCCASLRIASISRATSRGRNGSRWSSRRPCMGRISSFDLSDRQSSAA